MGDYEVYKPKIDEGSVKNYMSELVDEETIKKNLERVALELEESLKEMEGASKVRIETLMMQFTI